MMEKDFILAEIRRTAAVNNGKPLGRGRFASETGIQMWDWYGKYWPRWGDALVEAGFKPNELQGKYSDEDVLDALAAEVRRLGRMPSDGELRMRERRGDGFPTHGVFRRFGTKAQLTERLLAFCREGSDLADIESALITHLAAGSAALPVADGEGKASADPVIGNVYLLRSGRYYKIGRTNSFGRRQRELAIQLPEQPHTVHVIKTDDPEGIERYWHQRFAASRRHGEWFELTGTDVQAFKRRKFM